MKRLTLICLLLVASAAYAQRTLAVCPFEDQTGTQSGEQVGRLLPVMFLDRPVPGYRVVLANPGPMPDPSDASWLGEVARMYNADAILIGRIRTVGQGSKNAGAANRVTGATVLTLTSASLVTEYMLVDATGKKIREGRAEETVKGVWLGEATTYFSGIKFDQPKFASSSLGKAVYHSIDTIETTISPDIQALTAKDTSPAPAGGSCDVSFRVAYSEKNRASKVYSISVNHKEETLGVKDGVLTLPLASGPAMVRISVNDAPFRQLTQQMYYVNPIVDCAKAKTLVLEIGPSGEGVPKWK